MYISMFFDVYVLSTFFMYILCTFYATERLSRPVLSRRHKDSTSRVHAAKYPACTLGVHTKCNMRCTYCGLIYNCALFI